MKESRPSRRRRVVLWIAAAVVAAPILFLLFEVVIPKLLPSNF